MWRLLWWGGGCFSEKWNISLVVPGAPALPRQSYLVSLTFWWHLRPLPALAHSGMLFSVVRTEQHSLKTSAGMKGFSSNNCEDSVYYFSFKILPLDSQQSSLLFSFLTCEIVISKLNFCEMKRMLVPPRGHHHQRESSQWHFIRSGTWDLPARENWKLELWSTTLCSTDEFPEFLPDAVQFWKRID